MPVTRAHYAEILCRLAGERGVGRHELIKAAGIRDAQLGHPDNFITLDQFTELCRQALARCGDPGLGLEFGKRLKFTAHGALSQAAISCDTLKQALRILIKYFRIRFAYMSLSFFIEGDEAVIQLDIHHDTEDLHRFNIEVVLASMMDVNALLFGQRLLDGGRCLVDYPSPETVEAYRQVFGDIVSFDNEVNQLRFRKHLLDLPMSLSNPVARRVAEAQCEEELRQMDASSSVTERVVRLLESVRDGRLLSLDDVAGQLHVSDRTLRRQLAAEGGRFQALQEAVRHRRALKLLRRNNLMAIDEIAEHLGYSDPSNFARAFRKWEGISPSAWRRLQQDWPD
ncbi:AraC family transcriptional regulator [Marinobacter halophilus]|uniref:AraC family transcriptional regulator n=1 Tax=Marinobacter halophilus TaxID=1323740 RepID=UPI001D11931D|nr:AraC family transcriptional regulator [Marinobacter halophilus]